MKNILVSYFFIRTVGKPLIKPVNALGTVYSFLAGTISGTTVVHGMPPAVGAELTNHCNLNCPECNSGSGLMRRNRGFMSVDLFEKIIRELGPYLFNINLYFQGESMMHPQFFTFLEKCNGLYSTLSTNGHFLSMENSEKIVRSGLRKLIISLDGMDDKTYSAYRVNGDFEKVINGIRNISEARKRNSSHLKMIIQFLVTSGNEHQIAAVRKFAGEMDASTHFKSMQVINEDAFDSWIPSKRKYSRYIKKGNEYFIKSRLPDRCARLWFNPVITWDGKVLPCCFDKDGDHVMGDLNKETFRAIWNGPEYKKFRKNLLTGRRGIAICKNCTSGLK